MQVTAITNTFSEFLFLKQNKNFTFTLIRYCQFHKYTARRTVRCRCEFYIKYCIEQIWIQVEWKIIKSAKNKDKKINRLKTKRRLLYLKTQFVPRS